MGKTTLITALAARLAGSSPQARTIITKEPTPHFDLGSEQRLHGVDLAQAIAEDRSRHVADLIGPALAAGCTVVCDRYILSSFAFHTIDGVPEAVIEELNSGFPLPALNLVLRALPGELRRRRAQRGAVTRLQRDDLGAETAAYLWYAQRMQTQGVPLRVVDNSTMTDHTRLLDWLCARCTGSTP